VIEHCEAGAEAIAGGEISCGNVKRLADKQRLGAAKQLGRVQAGAKIGALVFPFACEAQRRAESPQAPAARSFCLPAGRGRGYSRRGFLRM
jgi:hypothetical protein